MSTITIQDPELLAEFIEESEEGVNVINQDLLVIEEAISGKEDFDHDLLNEMFRVAHSIKGASAFFGLTAINKLTHNLESLMDLVRSNKIPFTTELTSLLFKSLDVLTKLMVDVRKDGKEATSVDDVMASILTFIESGTTNVTPVVDSSHFVQEVTPVTEVETKSETEPETVSEKITETEDILDFEEAVKEEAKIDEQNKQKLPDADAENKKKSQKGKKAGVKEYLQEFVSETEENLTALNETLLFLEKEPSNENELNSAFRLAHTIKGSAGLLGYMDINKVMHSLEDLLAMVREKKISLNSVLISKTFELMDKIDKSLKSLKAGGDEAIDADAVVDEFNMLIAKTFAGDIVSDVKPEPVFVKEEIVEQIPVTPVIPVAPVVKAASSSVLKLKVVLDSGTSIKGMRALLIQKKLSNFAEVLSMTPNAEELDTIPEDSEGVVEFMVKTDISSEKLRDLINVDTVKEIHISDGKQAEKEKVKEKAKEKDKDKPVDKVQEPEKKKEKTKTSVKEEVKTMNVQQQNNPVNNETEEKIDADVIAQGAGGKAPMMQTVRVDIKKLDNLMNLAGELVITKAIYGQLLSRLSDKIFKIETGIKDLSTKITELDTSFKSVEVDMGKLSNSDNVSENIKKSILNVKNVVNSFRGFEISNLVSNFDETTSRLGKISSDIQSDVMLARMVPISGVFNKFKRIVRDLSLELKKNVKLEIYGEDTELDKKIIDEISDPLTHMIRNSMDHGIESPEVRVTKGKPEYGTIKLDASHKGNSVYVSVSDDGKGIDSDAIANAAIEKGMATVERVAQMSQKEKLNLILLPGFSTADKVTSLSGRGVGMDVVQKMVENVGGAVSIETEVGKGTKMVMKIPLTLAIIRALLVSIGEQIYAFPLDTVLEVVKISMKEIYSIDGSDTIKLRETPIALINLHDLIGLDRAYEFNENKKDDGKRVVVIVSDGNTTLGVLVSSLIGGEEIVIKSLSDHFSNVVGISGASILGNGAIAQILDVGAIIKSAG